MGRWRAGLGIGLAVSALAGAGAGAGIALSGSDVPGGSGATDRAAADGLRLVSYDGCPQMLGQLRTEALSMVGADGLSGGRGGSWKTAAGVPMFPGGMVSGGGMAAAPQAAAGTAGTSGTSGTDAAPSTPSALGGSGSNFSTTNNQEAGVDEPDLTKTDGRVLVSLQRDSDTLHVADVGSNPSLAGSLGLSGQVEATGLFLVGNDAVVLGDAVSSPSSGGTPPSPPQPLPAPPVSSGGASGAVASGPAQDVVPIGVQTGTTEVVVVDLSDPAHPTLARSFSLQGAEIDARLVGGTVEVVVSSAPHLPFVAPADASPGAVASATATNRNLVLTSSAAEWLPSVKSEPSGKTTVAPCSSAMHTVTTSGVDTIGVVPIDPSSDQPGSEVTVVGDATTVYASTSSLYVAFTTPSGPVAEPMQSGSSPADDTVIDKFDLSNPTAPSYVGSGDVPGSLIGQYAMSEYQRDLRVATTVGSATPPPGEGTAPTTLSDNRVTVLADQGGTLTPVGSVTGLGAGEKIYAVRFEGPLAYVVTFKQTDPLYVVDLHDPTSPKTAGQLPLTGYSSFLQPVGDGLLLGVGQNVNSNLHQDGLQVSLFDASDPSNPTLVSKDMLSYAVSPAQTDPHALLWWDATGTLLLPVTEDQPFQPNGSPACIFGATFMGAIVWHVSSGGLQQVGQISQPPDQGTISQTPPPPCATGIPGNVGIPPQIERGVVVGDKLYTVSETGILVSDLASLSQVTWMPYPAAGHNPAA